MAKIAFIGLGNMGAPMAANLLAANHELTVFDLDNGAVKSLVDQGAMHATSATEAAIGKEFVISMLPAGKHVESVYLGETGVLQAIDKGTTIIDSSTIDAATARKVCKAAIDRDIEMMDCPVSGGVVGATEGTLAFMCGGSDNAFAKIKPILTSMGKNIFHAGDHGAGQVAKCCNNMLLSVLMIATSEALKLGEDQGLKPATLSEIMLSSSGKNWTLENYNPCPNIMSKVPSSNDYQPGFMVDLMCKDLGLAMETAEQTHSKIPMGELAKKIYFEHKDNGNGMLDFSSIFKIF